MTIEKQRAKEAKQLKRLQAEQVRPVRKGYFSYLIVPLTMAFIIDMVGEQIHSTIQSNVVRDDKCAMCLGCLHRCPKFAIQYGNGKTKEHG